MLAVFVLPLAETEAPEYPGLIVVPLKVCNVAVAPDLSLIASVPPPNTSAEPEPTRFVGVLRLLKSSR